MRSRSFLAPLLAGAALALASCSANSTVPSSPGASAQSSNTAGMPAPPYDFIEAALPSTKLQSSARTTLSAGAISTIPFFTDSFTFGGTAFPFSMVGTSPFTTPATTIVPSEIQPITVVFANNTVIDGVAPANALAASPVFHSAAFPTETGQFVDVMQRANFNLIGTGYHVQLGTPTVLAPIVIKVPGSLGKVGFFSNHAVGIVNFNFLFNAVLSVVAFRNFDPTTLPVLVVGNVFGFNPPSRDIRRTCCVGGFHFAQLEGNGVVTFVFGAYNTPGLFADQAQDITGISHEVAEWANDPLVNNIVPPWGLPQNPSVCVSNLLEVGDPMEVFVPSNYPVTLNGTTYHPQDVAFFSWFAHQAPSIAVNGQYSYLAPEKLTSPPAACQ
jgi:hypothetical protein